MAFDALERTESCGGHFRLESQTEEGEALRMDDDFSYVAAWQYNGEDEPPTCHKEDLSFQYVLPSQRKLQIMKTINLKLKVWRQNGASDAGRFEDYDAKRCEHSHVIPRNARRCQ